MRTSLLLLAFATLLRAQAELGEAADLARAGRFAEARAKLTGVTEPQDTRQRIAFHRLRAAIASGLNQTSTAVEEMKAALQLAPNDPLLLVAAAMAETQAGQLEDALATAAKAGEYAPAWALKGDIEDKRGHLQDSLEAYRRAITLDPASEKYRVALALEMIEHQAMVAAAEMLREALPLFPHSGVLRTLLGVSLYAIAEPAAAEDAFSDAIRVAPDYQPAYRCLARIVLESSASPAQPTFAILCGWDSVVCSAIRLREARTSGDEKLWKENLAVLKRAPAENSVASCALAQAYVWKDEWDKARRPAETCLRFDPSPQQHYRLSQIYKKLGHDDLARQQLAARKELLEKMSEQTAQGLSVLRAMNNSGK